MPGRIHQIVCTGNLQDRETYDFLRSVCPNIHLVQGSNDDISSLQLPVGATPVRSLVLKQGALRIGVTHADAIFPPLGNHEGLAMAARQMDVDLLIWGGTHLQEIFDLDGRFFINPGSATGAISGTWPLEKSSRTTNGIDDNGSKSDDENPDELSDLEADEPIPSFVLIDVQGSQVVAYSYRLVNDQVKVLKQSWRRSD